MITDMVAEPMFSQSYGQVNYHGHVSTRTTSNIDTVVIPTYDRPEYLWVCLEHLSRAHGIQNKRIWICEDNHVGVEKHFTIQIEMLATIREAERLFGRDNVIYEGRLPHPHYGNSHNVLTSLLEAYYSTSGFVYLVEDDAMVLPDFFEWHEQAQKQFKPFVTCAGRINRSLNFPINGPEAIDETIKDPMACVRSSKAYMSWATCFSRESLRRLLWDRPDDTSWKPGWEQDLYIQKFLQDSKSKSVWPHVPRAYHMGWYSYHRTAGMKFNGTLEEKVAALRSTITSKSKIKEMAGLQDIDAIPKEQIVWQTGDLYLQEDYQ
jgi:hypothetical protein